MIRAACIALGVLAVAPLACMYVVWIARGLAAVRANV